MLMITFCYFDPEVKFRHLWSIFSTPDFSRRECRAVSAEAHDLWSSLLLGPIGHLSSLWSTVSTSTLAGKFLSLRGCSRWDWCFWWTRRSLALIVIDCLYFSSSRQVSKLAWLQLVRLMLVMIFRYLDPLVNFRYLSSHMWSSFTTWTHRSLSLLVINCLHFKP